MKILSFLFSVCFFAGLFAGEMPPPVNKPVPPPVNRVNRRAAALAWRAFSKLSPEERKAMMELQRTQPEEFQKKMKELAQKMLAGEQAKRAALRKLQQEYRSCTDNTRKTQLKTEIEKALRMEYMSRLQEHRQHLEEMKQRTAKMEKELNRRAEKADEAIQARLQVVLEGGDPFAPPRRLNRGK